MTDDKKTSDDFQPGQSVDIEDFNDTPSPDDIQQEPKSPAESNQDTESPQEPEENTQVEDIQTDESLESEAVSFDDLAQEPSMPVETEASGIQEETEEAPLFDEFGDAGATDDSFHDDEYEYPQEQAAPKKSVSHMIVGVLVIVVVVVAFYFFKDTLLGTSGGTVQPQALQESNQQESQDIAQSGENATAEANAVAQSEEMQGLLMNPEKARDISGSDVEVEEGTLDFGQPPMPTPITSSEYVNVSPDDLIKEEAEQVAEEAETSSSDEDMMAETNDLPLPNNVEALEESAEPVKEPVQQETAETPVENKGMSVVDSGEDAPPVDEEEIAPEVTEDNDKAVMTSGTAITESAIEEESVPVANETEEVVIEEVEPMPQAVMETSEPQEKPVTPVETTSEIVEKPQPKAAPKAASQPTNRSGSQWELRSAQMGVAWLAEKGDGTELLRVTEGQSVRGLGIIKKIAPVNGIWVVEGTKNSVTQK